MCPTGTEFLVKTHCTRWVFLKSSSYRSARVCLLRHLLFFISLVFKITYFFFSSNDRLMDLHATAIRFVEVLKSPGFTPLSACKNGERMTIALYSRMGLKNDPSTLTWSWMRCWVSRKLSKKLRRTTQHSSKSKEKMLKSFELYCNHKIIHIIALYLPLAKIFEIH